MNLLVFIFLFLTLPRVSAQTPSGVERLNFFPEAKRFVDLTTTYAHTNIDTPAASVQTKEVNSYVTRIKLTYGQRYKRNFFGATLPYEAATENAVTYGIPTRDRFYSQGFQEPEFFWLRRLKTQRGERGLVDMYLAASPRLGNREVTKEQSTKLNGRNTFTARISHGLWEDQWEFQSSIEWLHYGKGREENDFSESVYSLHSFNDYAFRFAVQYRFMPQTFGLAHIRAIYRGTQKVSDTLSTKRELQAGTGSEFLVGLKQIFLDQFALRGSYSIYRNDYFVKGAGTNLDGEQITQNFILSLTYAF
jgi:hypothetical protein